MKKFFPSGMTLIEVLVSLAIFSMSIIAFSMLFSNSWKSNAFVLKEGQESSALSYTVDRITSDLRKTRQGDDGSYPIQSASDNDLVVFINQDSDSATERVHYFYQNGTLKMGVSEPSGNPLSYPNTDTTVTTLASYIVNDANNPVFTYYNNNYPNSANPVPTPVSNLNMGNVRLIKIHLMMNMNPTQAPKNINIESFAELRNLNDYND